ncbi:MAG TPA: hypothetical protein VGI70_08510 [Polyangiales bacterium]
MQIELRDLDRDAEQRLDLDVLESAIGPTLSRFENRVGLVRVRFSPNGSFDTTCRVRVWCGKGQTLIIEEHGRSKLEAIHAAADALKRSLHGRWSRVRARTRRGDSPLRLGRRAV